MLRSGGSSLKPTVCVHFRTTEICISLVRAELSLHWIIKCVWHFDAHMSLNRKVDKDYAYIIPASISLPAIFGSVARACALAYIYSLPALPP